MTILLGRAINVPTRLAVRTIHSSAVRSLKRPRIYRYAIDVHGQLFLHDTKPKNLTSCFKNPDFLNFFFTRIRQNDSDAKKADMLEEEWTETLDCSLDDALSYGRAQGYHWISPCQGEYNIVRVSDSPIVFRDLDERGNLTWAGSLQVPFQPDALRVDAETGYVYHPSPEPPLSSLRKRMEQDVKSHPYGAYSLLSSSLVLERLTSGLDVDPEQFQNGKGGSIRWNDQRFDMGVLHEDDVARHRRVRVDDRAE